MEGENKISFRACEMDLMAEFVVALKRNGFNFFVSRQHHGDDVTFHISIN